MSERIVIKALKPDTTEIVIAPSRNHATASWSLICSAFALYALYDNVEQSHHNLDKPPVAVVVVLLCLVVAFVLFGILNASWIWFGGWSVKLSAAHISVHARLLGITWKYTYEPAALTNLQIKEFQRRGHIVARRVVAWNESKLIYLSPILSEEDCFEFLQRFKALKVAPL
ncbi:MAG: hypothetical protein V4607_12680 [Pseudomonadota bacterium]